MITRMLRSAEHEALAAAKWYERQRRGLGVQFLAALAEAIEMVAEHPREFAFYDSALRQHDVRFARAPRFPYLVVYQPRADHVLIIAVAHAHRRPNFWKRWWSW